jgi:hypothetical protein
VEVPGRSHNDLADDLRDPGMKNRAPRSSHDHTVATWVICASCVARAE